MHYSVAICSKNRPEYLLRAYSSVLNQIYPPNEIIIVETQQDVLTNYKIKQIFIKGYSCVFVYLVLGSDFSKPNISKSRNIALKICSNNRLIFVDDDVILNRRTLKMLNQVKDRVPNIFAVTGKVIAIGNSIFSEYMTFFHNKNVVDIDKPQTVETLSNTAILIDIKKQRESNIWFNEYVDSGEDALFYCAFAKQKKFVLYCPKINIYHDFFLNNPFNFIKRFFWYSSSMPKINLVESEYYGEFYDYLPSRKLHYLFFPLFALIRAWKLTNIVYESKGISTKMILPEFTKTLTYIFGVTYGKKFKLKQ